VGNHQRRANNGHNSFLLELDHLAHPYRLLLTGRKRKINHDDQIANENIGSETVIIVIIVIIVMTNNGLKVGQE
jgi:hypothetical protein